MRIHVRSWKVAFGERGVLFRGNLRLLRCMEVFTMALGLVAVIEVASHHCCAVEEVAFAFVELEPCAAFDGDWSGFCLDRWNRGISQYRCHICLRDALPINFQVSNIDWAGLHKLDWIFQSAHSSTTVSIRNRTGGMLEAPVLAEQGVARWSVALAWCFCFAHLECQRAHGVVDVQECANATGAAGTGCRLGCFSLSVHDLGRSGLYVLKEYWTTNCSLGGRLI